MNEKKKNNNFRGDDEAFLFTFFFDKLYRVESFIIFSFFAPQKSKKTKLTEENQKERKRGVAKIRRGGYCGWQGEKLKKNNNKKEKH